MEAALKNKIIETLREAKLTILVDRREEAWRIGMFTGTDKEKYEKCDEWAKSHHKVKQIQNLITELI